MLPSFLLSLSVIEAEPRAPIKRPRRGVADTAHEAAENGEKETNYASGDAGRVPIVPLFIFVIPGGVPRNIRGHAVTCFL